MESSRIILIIAAFIVTGFNGRRIAMSAFYKQIMKDQDRLGYWRTANWISFVIRVCVLQACFWAPMSFFFTTLLLVLLLIDDVTKSRYINKRYGSNT